MILNFNFYNLSFLFVFFIITNLIKPIKPISIFFENIDMSFRDIKSDNKSTAGNLATPFGLGTGYKFHYLKKIII